MKSKKRCWLYVDRHIIAANKKNGTRNPPISVRTYKGVTKAQKVYFGNWMIGYFPEKPLHCGATVYAVGPHNEITRIEE